MDKAQILVVLAMLSVGLQSVSAAPIEGQFVEENNYQWSVQVTHCEPTIDMTKYPVIVGEKAVYLVLLDERDVQKGGGLCDYQPALMPVRKDFVEISGNKLSFKVNLEGQKLPFYCLYLGAPFPDKLVMVTIEELAKYSVRYDWGYVSGSKPLTLSFLRKIVEAFESQVDNPFPHSAFKNEAVWNAVRDTPYIISGPVHVSAVDYGTDYVELEIEIPVRTDVTELTGTIEVKSGESTQTLSVTGSDVVNGVIKKRVRVSQASDTVKVTIQLSGVVEGQQVTDVYPVTITVQLVKLNSSVNITVEKITESEAVLRVDYQINAENCSVKSVEVKLLKDGNVVASEERSQAEGTVRFTVNESGTYRVVIEATVEWTTPSGRHEKRLTLASEDVEVTLSRLEVGAPSVKVSDYGADWATLEITVPVTAVGCEVTGGKVEVIEAGTGHTLATTEATVDNGVLKATVKLTGLRSVRIPIIVRVTAEGKTPTGDSVTATAEASVEVRLASAELGGSVRVEEVSSESATLRVCYEVHTENCTVESVTVELLKRTDQGWVVVDRRTLSATSDVVTFRVSEEGQYKVRITAQCTHGVTMTAETEPVTVQFLPKVEISGFKVVETDYGPDWVELRITADVHVERAEKVSGLVVVEDAKGNILGKFPVEISDHMDVKVRLEGLENVSEELPVVVKLRIEAGNNSGKSYGEVSVKTSLKLEQITTESSTKTSSKQETSSTTRGTTTGGAETSSGSSVKSHTEASESSGENNGGEAETETGTVTMTPAQIKDLKAVVEKVKPGQVTIDVSGRIEVKHCRSEIILVVIHNGKVIKQIAIKPSNGTFKEEIEVTGIPLVDPGQLTVKLEVKVSTKIVASRDIKVDIPRPVGVTVVPTKGKKYTVIVYEDGSVYVVDGQNRVVNSVVLSKKVKRIVEVRGDQLVIETQTGERCILKVDERGELRPAKFLVIKSGSYEVSVAGSAKAKAKARATPLILILPILLRLVRRSTA